LSLLKRNHDESSKAIEEYQRKETVYEQTIAAYQKRLTETEYTPAPAESAAGEDRADYFPVQEYPEQDTVRSLYSLKNDIINLQNTITERLNRETW
jgi:hypothetical protein